VSLVTQRDHGGGLDAAIARYGGIRNDWIDLSTGINPKPYPLPEVAANSWRSLPDRRAVETLEKAARNFWSIPDGADVLAAPGASALIARIPGLMPCGTVAIPGPTYNEHAAAFLAHGWQVSDTTTDAKVIVHPNNPDGRFCDDLSPAQSLTIIDESFGDIAPNRSFVNLSTRPGTLILKSFGKFWGLAGLRLGFAIGDPQLIRKLAESLGPWPVSGPALAIGTIALSDPDWATDTRRRLARDAQRLDELMLGKGANIVGGTDLFRLYDVDNAAIWQSRFAKAHIWTRTFPYSDHWLRLGLPSGPQWSRLSAVP